MKNKKSLIISTLLILITCFSLICGATFALFTSESKSNIAINAGKVEMVATIDNMKTYSMDVEQGNSGFENGGVATLTENKLTLDRLTPGDKVTFDITLTNKSNVAIKYQTAVSYANDTGLVSGLIIKIGNKALSNAEMQTEWTKLDANVQPSPSVISVEIELPESAGNEYQEKKVDLFFLVNAVQLNAETFPSASIGIVTENGIISKEAVYAVEGVMVTIPAGVKVESGRTSLPISIYKKDKTDSDIKIEQAESLAAYDVHVEGIATDNVQPVIVKMQEVLPKNLNSSAVEIYHVEGGNTVKMEYVALNEQLAKHNQFHYDPATGDLTIAVVSFSEITLVANTDNPWDGAADTTWYSESNSDFTIRNAQQLAGFAQIVANGTDFTGKTVKLAADISLKDNAFYPIGAWSEKDGQSYGLDYSDLVAFSGTFDGMGHEISNLAQDGWNMKGGYTGEYYNSAMGLFAKLNNATVKNLSLDNFECVMEFANTGCVAGFAEGECVFENIAVTNANLSAYNCGVAGIVGWDSGSGSDFTFKNITVDSTNTMHALWGTYDCAAAGIMGYMEENSAASFENCNVSAVLDIYNDYCGNYQWGIYRYCGMYIGAVAKTTTDQATGRLICDLSKVTATNCTVNFGEWSKQYYYCEFEKNGHPSYAGPDDYKFSRVPFEDITITNGTATCNHTHTEVEDGKAWQFVFDAVFGSWGNWGVTPTELEKYPAITISEEVQAQEKFKVNFENTDKYLYRVGNGNAVALSSLFSALEGKNINNSGVYVSVEKLDENTDVTGTFTANTTDWTKGTLKLEGTGLVRLTIQDYDYCTPTELLLEVVDGKNVTKYSELNNGNCVLISDITMPSNGQYYLSNAAFYGNGFIFDVTAGKHGDTNKGSISNNYVICLKDAILDNVKVVGSVYTSYGAMVKDDYNFPIVLSTGKDVISNSYISNGSAPIRVNNANLTVENTLLKGGNFANLDIRNGKVVLDNVTTINQVGLNDTANGTVVVGLGIVSYYENVLDTTTITIKNGIKQYNHMQESDADYIKDSTAKTLFNAMFDYADAIYTDGSGNKWINTGIISMSSAVGDDNISDISGYIGVEPSLLGNSGFAYIPAPSAPITVVESYVANVQGAIAPTFSFDYTNKNYVAKTDGSNEYCYEDGGVVKISFDEGETFNWDTSILTVKKVGQELPYTVSMNGIDYTDKSIPFSTSGEYTVIFTYTDNNNYVMNNGAIGTESRTYEKTVTISVSAVKATAKHAEFAFEGGSPSTTVSDSSNNTYIMPTTGTGTQVTINGVKINTTKIETTASDGKRSHSSGWYEYFPVFKGVVAITDYSDGGAGAAITYGASTTSLPSGLKPVAYSTNGTGWTETTASTIFKYQSSSSAADAPKTVSNVLYYSSPSISKARDEDNLYVKYSYTDNAGSTFYYVVHYYTPSQSYSGGCVTPETLITLANGSQVMAKDLTGKEDLLVWNHTTGKLETAPIAYIVNHGKEEGLEEVIILTFSNGKQVEVIGEHVFFDTTLNKYVSLDYSAERYVGHEFAMLANAGIENAELVSVASEMRYTTSYEVVTYQHLTCFTNGVLSTSAFLDSLLNIFEMDAETLTYSAEQVQKDIETYGLYTYKDFEGLLPEIAFDLYNVKYLKIAVGKGQITWDGILELIDIYYEVGVNPIG